MFTPRGFVYSYNECHRTSPDNRKLLTKVAFRLLVANIDAYGNENKELSKLLHTGVCQSGSLFCQGFFPMVFLVTNIKTGLNSEYINICITCYYNGSWNILLWSTWWGNGSMLIMVRGSTDSHAWTTKLYNSK